MGMERHSSWYNRVDNGVFVYMRTKQNPHARPRRLSRLISEQDLRNIGLSKYYVENIMNRVREYKEIGYKKMWERVGVINGN